MDNLGDLWFSGIEVSGEGCGGGAGEETEGSVESSVESDRARELRIAWQEKREREEKVRRERVERENAILANVAVKLLFDDDGALKRSDFVSKTKKRMQTTFMSEVDDFSASFSLTEGTAHFLADLLLETDCEIATLDLFRNNLGDTGLQQIMSALQKNKSVKSLSMAIGDPITTAGLKHIGEMLSRNNRITYLHLTFFRGGLQIDSLVGALARNKHLQTLELVHARITEQNFLQMADVLEKNYSLLQFGYDNLYQFYDDVAGAVRVKELCARNHLYVWQRIHPLLLDFCIAMHALHLPPYVLLEIFDFLPDMWHASELKKIQLIEGVQKSARRFRF